MVPGTADNPQHGANMSALCAGWPCFAHSHTSKVPSHHKEKACGAVELSQLATFFVFQNRAFRDALKGGLQRHPRFGWPTSWLFQAQIFFTAAVSLPPLPDHSEVTMSNLFPLGVLFRRRQGSQQPLKHQTAGLASALSTDLLLDVRLDEPKPTHCWLALLIVRLHQLSNSCSNLTDLCLRRPEGEEKKASASPRCNLFKAKGGSKSLGIADVLQ